MEGTKVREYRLIERLDAGGMGEIYRARHERLARDVALKVILAKRLGEANAAARFVREARLLVRLEHPSLVKIIDFFAEDGRDWLVMELLDGVTLRQQMDAGRLEILDAVRYAKAVAEGLVAAHAIKVIHRDLKAENVMLTSHGGIKIVDFGLAKEYDDETLATGEVFTRGAKVVGTIYAFSPEQVDSQKADLKTDLFSLGGLLYEMLTGEHPFRQNNVGAMLHRICHHRQPPAAVLDPRIPTELSELVDALLEKDRTERPGAEETARQLRIIEQRLLDAPEDTARDTAAVPRERPGKSIGVGLAGVAVLLLLVLGGFWTMRPASLAGSERSAGSETSSLPPVLVISAFENRTGSEALGGFGAYAAELLSAELAAGPNLRVRDERWVESLGISLDGESLPLFFRLEVHYLLSGFYFADENGPDEVHLVLRLIDTHTGEIVWTFQRNVGTDTPLEPLAQELRRALRRATRGDSGR